MNNFICTFDNEIAKELESKLKLIQKIRNNDKTLYVFVFDKMIFEKYENKNIWLSNKLFF